MILYLDTETRSYADLKKVGLPLYCKQGVEVIILTYGIRENENDPVPEVKVWQPLTERMPKDLRECFINKKTPIIAHNSRFDRSVINSDLNILKGYKLPPERYVCSMVQALEHQFPRGLGLLSKVLLPKEERKLSKNGKKLIDVFCKPHIDKKTKQPYFIEPDQRPEEWKSFIEYAVRDTEAMIKCIDRMPKYNYPGIKFYSEGIATEEYKAWVLDEYTNDYGINIDLPLIKKAIEAGSFCAEKVKQELWFLTDGLIESPYQDKAILSLLNSKYKLDLPSLKRDVLIKAYVENKNPEAEELIRLRLLGSQSAASKFKKAAETNVDGVVKHTIQFAGASQTGRWAGTGFQPQNMKRPAYSQEEMDKAIIDIMADPEEFVFKHPSPALMLGSLVTGCIIPREGNKLCVCDYSSVESRVIRWLSKDDKGLQFFRDYDKGLIAHDLYMVAYGNSFNVPYDEVTKLQRQDMGKPVELSFGFGGGCGAFLNTVKGNFGKITILDNIGSYKSLEVLVKSIRDEALIADPVVLASADSRYDFALEHGFDHGLTRSQYGAIDYLKQKWRAANYMIEEWWGLLQDAFINALDVEGVVFYARRISFLRSGNRIYMRLPSGKIITFWEPSRRVIKNKKTGIEEIQLTYKKATNDAEPKWVSEHIYGGKLAAIATQATARELLVPKLPILKDAGYKIVFTKHDEIIAECRADDSVRGYKQLKSIMEEPLAWCLDLPIVSAGYETTERYRKD